MTVKSYRVMSLLNCFGKMCKKAVANMLTKYCEVNLVLNVDQMGFRKQKSIIDAVTRVFNLIQKPCQEGKITDMLLMNVKLAFDYVSRNSLVCTMIGMSADGVLMRWTE